MIVSPVRPAGILLAVGATFLASPATAQRFVAPSFATPAWTAAQSFTSVTGVRELRSGAVLVADFSEPAVYLISAVGKSAKVIGRKGAGPSEYTSPSRLFPLPGDSTLILDRDADRYLVVDPNGKIVSTTPFPAETKGYGQLTRSVDGLGRVYFQSSFVAQSETGPNTLPILRWNRPAIRIDSVATVMMPTPKVTEGKLPSGEQAVTRRLMPFSAADDWMVAPSGRIAVLSPSPYRLTWHELNGKSTVGAAVAFQPVPVTDQDRKAYEPKGPPFRLIYPETKPPFVSTTMVVDHLSRVWVQRSVAAGAKTRQWDVFDAAGKLIATVPLSSDRKILTVTARFIYVIHRDADDVQWLEAYAW